MKLGITRKWLSLVLTTAYVMNMSTPAVAAMVKSEAYSQGSDYSVEADVELWPDWEQELGLPEDEVDYKEPSVEDDLVVDEEVEAVPEIQEEEHLLEDEVWADSVEHEGEEEVALLSDEDSNTISDFNFDPDTNTIVTYSANVNVNKHVVIPAQINGHDVLHIGEEAFAGRQLLSLEIEEGSKLQTIGARAFYNNLDMTGTVTFPDTLTTISTDAFYYTALSVMYFNTEQTATSVNTGVCEAKLTSTNSTTGQWGMTNIETALVWPHMTYDVEQAILINNDTNTLVRHYPEHNREVPVTSIIIPEGIQYLENDAFRSDAYLTYIEFPSTLETIGTYACYGITLATEIDFSHTQVTSIGDGAFGYNTSATYAMLPETVESIGAYAFYKNALMERINLPESLHTIGSYAFSESGVVSIHFPSQITTIPASVFRSTTALEEVTFGGDVTSFGNYAFNGCTNLRTLESEVYPFPSTVLTVGSYAFSGASSLTGVLHFPSVTTINTYAFSSTALTGLHFTCQNLTSVGNYALWYMASLVELTLPESLSATTYSLFYGMKALKTLNVMQADGTIMEDYNGAPPAITTYPSMMYYNCYAIEKIDVSPELVSVGGSAFSGCELVMEYHFPSTLETIGTYAFRYSADDVRIYIDKDYDTVSGQPWEASESTWVIWNGMEVGQHYGEGGELDHEFLLLVNYDEMSATITNYKLNNLELVIPERVVDASDPDVWYDVTGVGYEAFDGSSITSLDLAGTVLDVAEYAFANCYSLKSIVLREGITQVSPYMFYRQPLITEVLPVSFCVSMIFSENPQFLSW